MFRVFEYAGRFQTFRGRMGRLPGWAKLILLILALPGIALGILAIALFAVTILALFLLVAPAYRLLKAIFAEPGKTRVEPGGGDIVTPEGVVVEQPASQAGSTRRPIEVRIIQ
jgi:hypothetical protein